MPQPIDQRRLGHIWLERIVWNAAAAAALAVMIGILLCSLRWLDQVDPQSVGVRTELEADAVPGSISPPEMRQAPTARVNAPSG